jgi:hypothetical protein
VDHPLCGARVTLAGNSTRDVHQNMATAMPR